MTRTFSFFRLLVATLMLAPSGRVPLSAQATPAREPLDLTRALELARQHAPGLRVADARRDASLGRAREVAQFANPSIEYRRENLGSTLSPDIFTTLYVPFDVTGRRLALRRLGGAASQRAESDGLAERRESELRVARAWLRAAAAGENAAVSRAQAEALMEVAIIDASRAREGLVAEGVALRTRLEADRARVAQAAAIGEMARARAELSRAVGVPDHELPQIGALVAPSLPAPPDTTAASELAARSRPEMHAREAALREAQARLSAEQRGTLGDWQLQGGSKKTAGVMTGQVGLAVPFPLFNRNDGARQRARGELSEATAWRDDVSIGVRADAVAALTAYLATRAHAGDAATFAQRGRDVASIARIAYREGQASLVELLDAERASTDAMTTHIRWAVDAWMTRLELERAIGARLDAQSPLDLPLHAALPSTPR
ncbi:MAG: TolC family protein [Gemmatimonas sp.]